MRYCCTNCVIAVLLLDGVAYTVRLTQASALTQFLVRGCLKLGCELLWADSCSRLVVALSFQSTLCLRCLPLVDYSAYVKAGIGRFLLERRKAVLEVVTGVVRGWWLKWPLLPLLGDDRLIRKVLWTARLSLRRYEVVLQLKSKSWMTLRLLLVLCCEVWTSRRCKCASWKVIL
ncbi:MAG: hypothetical protein ACKERG_01875 [Candidatus Hodgkinia cicadicola]